MTEQHTTPELPEDPSQDDHFLEEMAAVTGLFNPEMIVVELQDLDRLEEQEHTQDEAPAPEAVE